MTGFPVLKVCIGPLLQSAAFTTNDYINSSTPRLRNTQNLKVYSIHLKKLYMCNIQYGWWMCECRGLGINEQGWKGYKCWAMLGFIIRAGQKQDLPTGAAEIIGKLVKEIVFLEILVFLFSCNWQLSLSVTSKSLFINLETEIRYLKLKKHIFHT